FAGAADGDVEIGLIAGTTEQLVVERWLGRTVERQRNDGIPDERRLPQEPGILEHPEGQAFQTLEVERSRLRTQEARSALLAGRARGAHPRGPAADPPRRRRLRRWRNRRHRREMRSR